MADDKQQSATDPNRIALSLKESAMAVGVSPDHLRNEIREGRLIAHKSGTRTIIKVLNLGRWIDAMPLVEYRPKKGETAR